MARAYVWYQVFEHEQDEITEEWTFAVWVDNEHYIPSTVNVDRTIVEQECLRLNSQKAHAQWQEFHNKMDTLGMIDHRDPFGYTV